MVAQTVGKKKRKVARLVGRLVRRSAKLHPSMPVGGGLLKTSIISDVHLDLVRVVSGQVYKLRSPSARYLASLSTYDSSNPTKDWGFPDLLANMDNTPTSDFEASHGSEAIDGESCANHGQPLSSKEKQRGHVYRDRAAERRTLHGGFGIGPGQKTFANGGRGREVSCSESLDTEEAAAEAQHMSFGAGSYARKILEGMGWKEGEALGNNSRGLKEPLQAVGNKGCAGLGWNSHDRL
ncbi:uncharacterized protein LOC131246627 [Magnolia sinica]|uniref:uncharacterized protein LOC131246627 n=1 Tax=Magnolia sinica TaxID=86752 RepID=UPI002657B4D8|nr:uncharacterized protein LOC131246627 [Magnolia sinica]